MKRFLLLMLALWRQQLKLYLIAALVGAGLGILILAPSYSFIYSQEINSGSRLSSLEYMLSQLSSLANGNLAESHLILFYAEIGAILGLISVGIYGALHKHLSRIEQLKVELQKDLMSIVAKGEGPLLEFKSSFRWDFEQSRINRNLETIVLKTLAGFLNSSHGGTLLIGIADNGEVIGLEQDFKTLKKPNQDGFEQSIMTAVSTQLGADLCSYIHVLFHATEGKQVCRLLVTPAPRPVFLQQNGAPKLFVRTGGATRDLNIQEALEYYQIRWQREK